MGPPDGTARREDRVAKSATAMKRNRSAFADVTEAFREKYGLTATEFIDLLKRHGVPTANPVTLHRWENGRANPGVVHQAAWRQAMDQIGQRIEEALAQGTEPRDDILRLAVARLSTKKRRR